MAVIKNLPLPSRYVNTKIIREKNPLDKSTLADFNYLVGIRESKSKWDYMRFL